MEDDRTTNVKLAVSLFLIHGGPPYDIHGSFELDIVLPYSFIGSHEKKEMTMYNLGYFPMLCRGIH